MKVKIHNFQSIADAELTFDKGLIAITGPNSSGKSAIFRALRSVIQNPSTAKHSVKKGTKRAEVTISGLDNAPDVTWARTSLESSYKTAEGEFQRAGRNNVYDFLPSFPLKMDGARMLNFQTEWDTLFPFEKSNTELYTLFERIFSVVDSASIVNVMKQDEKEAKAKLNNTIDELNKLSQREQLRKDIFTDDQSEAMVLELVKKVEETETLASAAKEAYGALSTWSSLLELAKKVTDITVSDTDLTTVKQALDLRKDYDTVCELSKLLALSNISPIECFIGGIEEYFAIARDLEDLETMTRIVNSFSLDTPLFDDGSLDVVSRALAMRADYLNLTKLESLTNEAQGVQDINSSLTALDELSSVLPKITQLKDALTLYEELMKKEAELAELEKDLAEVNAELNKINVCPLCGTPIGDHKHE